MVERASAEPLSAKLAKLPKADKAGILTSFVAQQRQNVTVYEREGRQYLATWGKEESKKARGSSEIEVKSPGGRDARDGAGAAYASGHGRGGIPSPVLKSRKSRRDNEATEGEPAQRKGRTSDKEKIAKKIDKGGASKPRREPAGEEAISTTKKVRDKEVKIQTRKPQREQEEASEVNTETRERESRLQARRDRRRTNRDIVNPKKRKASSTHEDSSEEAAGYVSEKRKGEGTQHKKPKIPAGLALMHGFSATNVGKARLTIDPGTRPSGVFSKGKASTKATTSKKTAASTRFSELQFLNRAQTKAREPSPSAKEAARKSKTKKPKEDATEKPSTKSKSKKRARTPSPEPTDEENSSNESIDEIPEGTRDSSVTWDIERESAVLPSTDVSVPLATRATKPKSPSTTTGSEDHPTSQVLHASSSMDTDKASISPLDSASQVVAKSVQRSPAVPKRPVRTDTFSKYFQRIIDDDEGKECRKEVAIPVACPSFQANELDPRKDSSPRSTMLGGKGSTGVLQRAATSRAAEKASDAEIRRVILHSPERPDSWTYPSFSDSDDGVAGLGSAEHRDSTARTWDHAPMPLGELEALRANAAVEEADLDHFDGDLEEEQAHGVPPTFRPSRDQEAEGQLFPARRRGAVHDPIISQDWGLGEYVSTKPLRVAHGAAPVGYSVVGSPPMTWKGDGETMELLEETLLSGEEDEVPWYQEMPWPSVAEACRVVEFPDQENTGLPFDSLDAHGDWDEALPEFIGQVGEVYHPEDIEEGYLDCQQFNSGDALHEDEWRAEEVQTGFLEGNPDGGGEYGMDDASLTQGEEQDPCHFLAGRSALLGFEEIMVGRRVKEGEKGFGATELEIDVGKRLKNHWRPQRL